MTMHSRPVAQADDRVSVSEAFSRKSRIYDAFGEDHPNLARMRARVHARLLALLRPGDSILELNAGTGSDAAYLARQGFRVHATDIAPGMLAAIKEKQRSDPLLAERLTVQNCSFTELHRVEGGPFQAVFSNMGGLNCTPDLTLVTRALPALLTPGAVILWVVMPRFSLWETAAILLGDARTATRRWSRKGTIAHVEGVYFPAYYFWPRDVIAAFDPRFKLLGVEGLSVFTPPADRKAFAHRYPRIYRLLVALDDRLAPHPPFRAWGDFFILSMRYEPDGESDTEADTGGARP